MWVSARRLSVHLIALATITAAAPLVALAAPPPDDFAKLRAQGDEASEAGRIPDAIDAWTRAWKIRPSFSLACAIGRAELLGRANVVGAAKWLDRCVKMTPRTTDPQELSASDEEIRLLNLARSHVGALRVETEAGAEIAVDGAPRGRAPLREEIFLEPGPHRVTSTLGPRSRAVDVTLARGGELTVTVALPAPPLRPSASPPAAQHLPPAQPARAASSAHSPPRGPFWAIASGAVVTVAGGFAGAGFWNISNAAYADSLRTLDEVRAGNATVCQSTDDARCFTYQELDVKGDTFATASGVAFAVAGAAAAVTLGVALWPDKAAPTLVASAQGFQAVWSW